MKEVFENLYISNQADYENGTFDPNEWSVLLAAKEPFHRSAIGYKGRALNKDHPEYLMARRDNKLILNLVDAPKSIFFDKNIIDAGLEFIHVELAKGKKVGVFCNRGESRSASLSLLYLIKHGLIKGEILEDAEAEFLKLYPKYNPGTGMREFVKENWSYYWRPF